MIDIKEWGKISPPITQCEQCEQWFETQDGLNHCDREPLIYVCSWWCAELFTADYNAGEAERTGEDR